MRSILILSPVCFVPLTPCIYAVFSFFQYFSERFCPLALSPRDTYKSTLLRHEFYLFSYHWIVSKYKTTGWLDHTALLLFLENSLLSTTTILMTPQWLRQPNGNKLIQSHLHLNKTDQRTGSVSQTLLICLPSFANEPYLTPTSLCYLLPPALSSTVSFWSSSTISPLILPSFQFTHPIVVAGCCGNGLSWLFSGEVGG